MPLWDDCQISTDKKNNNTIPALRIKNPITIGAKNAFIRFGQMLYKATGVLDPCMPNELSKLYLLDEPICKLRVAIYIFHFYIILNWNSRRQIFFDPHQVPGIVFSSKVSLYDKNHQRLYIVVFFNEMLFCAISSDSKAYWDAKSLGYLCRLCTQSICSFLNVTIYNLCVTNPSKYSMHIHKNLVSLDIGLVKHASIKMYFVLPTYLNMWFGNSLWCFMSLASMVHMSLF